MFIGGASTGTLDTPPATPYAAPDPPPAPACVGEQMPATVTASTPFACWCRARTASTYTILSISQMWQQLVELTGQPGLDAGYKVDVTLSITDRETKPSASVWDLSLISTSRATPGCLRPAVLQVLPRNLLIQAIACFSV